MCILAIIVHCDTLYAPLRAYSVALDECNITFTKSRENETSQNEPQLYNYEISVLYAKLNFTIHR